MKPILKIILGLGVTIVLLVLLMQGKIPSLAPPQEENVAIKADAPLFTASVTDLGIGLDRLSGYLSISPDGTKMLFNGFSNNSPKTFVADLTTGEVQLLEGNLLSDWVDKDFLLLTAGTDTLLYDFKTGKEYRIPSGGEIFKGSLSPDRAWYVFNTPSGLRLLNLATSEVTELTNHRYDGAYSWFSDSKRILGFRETGQNLFEAGVGRQLAIWDIETKEFTDVPVAIPIPTIRFTDWLVEDKIARVNAGFDDGSHDYLVDLETNEVTDLGDTSGMLFGGIRVDKELGIVALIGPVYGQSGEVKNTARIYRADDSLIKEIPFEFNPNSQVYIQRESMEIVDEGTLLYIKKVSDSSGLLSTDIVKLDFETGTEVVIFSAATLNQMDLIPDQKIWIAASTERFYLGTLK